MGREGWTLNNLKDREYKEEKKKKTKQRRSLPSQQQLSLSLKDKAMLPHHHLLPSYTEPEATTPFSILRDSPVPKLRPKAQVREETKSFEKGNLQY